MENKQYLEYVSQHAPKTKMFKTLLPSFLVGGIICCVGQGFHDLYQWLFKELSEKQLGSAVSMTMIFLGAFLTAVGVYDRIGRFAGGGSIVPITGFANSIVSPAMEYNREGIIFGVCSKMFVISGPIIIFGIAAAVLVGVIGIIFL